MGHILWMQPIFKEMLWGGNQLKETYQYSIPSEQTGECWAISAHPKGDCQVLEGRFVGKTLSYLWRHHPALFGNIQGEEFPLLVKLIDARQDLSVQVHPDDTYAREKEQAMGKTECWYVLDATEGAQMVLGHHAKTKKEWEIAIEKQAYDSLLRRFPIQEGDFFYIPAGTIHAICSGSLIYEVQQSSDITYRVYDYQRKDYQGKERELHIQQALDVMTIPFVETKLENQTQVVTNGRITTCITSPFFTVKKYEITGKYTMENHKPFQMLSIIKGNGTIENKKVTAGEHGIVCFDQKEVTMDGNMTIMVCTI